MHKVLQPKNGIDIFYISRKKRGKETASFEVCVDSTIIGFE